MPLQQRDLPLNMNIELNGCEWDKKSSANRLRCFLTEHKPKTMINKIRARLCWYLQLGGQCVDDTTRTWVNDDTGVSFC